MLGGERQGSNTLTAHRAAGLNVDSFSASLVEPGAKDTAGHSALTGVAHKRAHRTRAMEQSVSVSEQNPLRKCPVTNALSIFLPELNPIHAGLHVQSDHGPLQGSLLR